MAYCMTTSTFNLVRCWHAWLLSVSNQTLRRWFTESIPHPAKVSKCTGVMVRMPGKGTQMPGRKLDLEVQVQDTHPCLRETAGIQYSPLFSWYPVVAGAQEYMSKYWQSYIHSMCPQLFHSLRTWILHQLSISMLFGHLCSEDCDEEWSRPTSASSCLWFFPKTPEVHNHWHFIGWTY